MNTRRLTLATVVIALLVVAGFVLVPRLQPSTPTPGGLDLSDQPRLGPADAPVTIALFEDFLCSHCADFSEEVVPRLVQEYVQPGKAQLVFVNFQVIPGSETVARASECVYRQSESAFWELEPILFRSQAQLSDPRKLPEIVRTYAPGLDADAFERCLDGNETRDAVQHDNEMAQQLGLRGTPTVLVNGEQVANPDFEGVKAAVEQALTKAD